MSNTIIQALNGWVTQLHGVILIPGGLAVIAFAFGFISARFRWPGWRFLGGLSWLAAAIVAEVLIIQSVLTPALTSHLGVLLVGGSLLIPLGLVLALIEYLIDRQRARTLDSDPSTRQPARMPVAELGVGVAILVAISSILLPAAIQPLPPATPITLPTATMTATTIATITPVIPPTNTPHPSDVPTSTPLPSLTPTLPPTDIPTLMLPPTITPTSTVTATGTSTPRAATRTAAARSATALLTVISKTQTAAAQ